MGAGQFRVVALTAAGLVLAVVALAGSGLLSADAAETVDDLGQLLGAAALAAACCGRTGWRATGPERRWRLLVALGIGAWGLARAARTWAGLAGTDPGSPAVADGSQLLLAAFVLPALVVFATEGTRLPPRPVVRDGEDETGRSVPVLVLDGLVVIGSLLTLAWSSTLGVVVRGDTDGPVDLLVEVADPLVDLVLITARGAARRGPPGPLATAAAAARPRAGRHRAVRQPLRPAGCATAARPPCTRWSRAGGGGRRRCWSRWPPLVPEAGRPRPTRRRIDAAGLGVPAGAVPAADRGGPADDRADRGRGAAGPG